MKKYLWLFVILLAACGPVMPVVPPQPPITALPASTPTEIAPASALPTAALDVLPTPVSGGGYPAAIFAAQKHLAARLNISLDQIKVAGITPRDWPDSCLGISSADEMCAQVITPGYQVVFTVGAAQYTYHTDAQGKNLRQVAGTKPFKGSEQPLMLLDWTGPNCEQLSISPDTLFYGKCDESLTPVPAMNSADNEPLAAWLNSFASFEVDTPAGQLKFIGFGKPALEEGKSLASPADQRMIAEWAKLQFAAAQSGRAAAASGLAFGYHREGGFAGFCDDVAVYLDGRAVVSNCKGLNAAYYLTASEMQQVYAWYDLLSQLDYSSKDAAVADSMSISLAMPGQGQKMADEATLRAILEFASGLTAQAGYNSQPAPMVAEAELALRDYFSAMNSGDFALAARLYGGPTDILQAWNPDIKNDLPAWLQRACTQNGLVCMLPRSVRYNGLDSRGAYRFLVEFNAVDGSLFAQGPCCGATDGIINTRFSFSVLPVAGSFQVLDLPPYIP